MSDTGYIEYDELSGENKSLFRRSKTADQRIKSILHATHNFNSSLKYVPFHTTLCKPC